MASHTCPTKASQRPSSSCASAGSAHAFGDRSTDVAKALSGAESGTAQRGDKREMDTINIKTLMRRWRVDHDMTLIVIAKT